MNNFWTRTITGALFVAVMVFCIWWSYWTMALLFFVIVVLGLWEFYSLLEKANHHPQKYFAIIISEAFFISLAYFQMVAHSGGWSGLRSLEGMAVTFLILLLMFSTIFLIELFRNKQHAFTNSGLTVSGLFYILSPFCFLL